MAVSPAEFAATLLKEAQETHPWLHHLLFRMIYDGQLTRGQLQHVIRQQGCFFLDTVRPRVAMSEISTKAVISAMESLLPCRAAAHTS